MTTRFPHRLLRAFLIASLLVGLPVFAEDTARITFEQKTDRMAIVIDGAPFATYVWNDPEITRPYFANIHAPGGIKVTRNHPPDPVADAGNDDHASYHPGLWTAFGDLDGADFWRLKARVRHAGFRRLPGGVGNSGNFEVLNLYENNDGEVLCEEHCRYEIAVEDAHYSITMQSVFHPRNEAFSFGDQEEMGFGLRLATPLTVKHGDGELRNSAGGRNEAGTWGKAAAWCAGYGTIGDQIVGAVIVPSPENFRASWFHSRDYGLLVANPFGEKAMTGPTNDAVPYSATIVLRDAPASLGFRACFFTQDSDAPLDLSAFHDDCLDAFREESR